ncbi:MAG: hypothetical protein AAFX56_08235 [Pseudomonadota bacterium]
MDRHFVERHKLVERYRQGELSVEEQAEFEAFFIDNDELLETLELDQLLESGMIVDSKQPVGRELWSLRGWQLPVAAGVLLLLGVSLFYNVQLSGENRDYEAALSRFQSAQTNLEVLTLAPLRSQSDDFRPAAVLRLQPATLLTVVSVQLPMPTSAEFRVSIHTYPQGEAVIEIPKIEPRGAGDLVFSLSREQLPEGDYVLRASGIDDESVSIPFRVISESS